MATRQAGQIHEGQPFRTAEPHSEIPTERRTMWLMLTAALLALLLVVGLIVGFWRAASEPLPVIESPDLEAPPGDIQPRPR